MSQDDRKTRWNQHRHDRRARLLTAAIDAIMKYGADGNMAQIETNPDLYRQVMRRGGDGVPAVLSTSSRTLASGLAGVIGRSLRALGLDPGPAEPWARGMVPAGRP